VDKWIWRPRRQQTLENPLSNSWSMKKEFFSLPLSLNNNGMLTMYHNIKSTTQQDGLREATNKFNKSTPPLDWHIHPRPHKSKTSCFRVHQNLQWHALQVTTVLPG
jgi:hypothetical protein